MVYVKCMFIFAFASTVRDVNYTRSRRRHCAPMWSQCITYMLTFLSFISMRPASWRLESVWVRMGTSNGQIRSWIPTQSACWCSAWLRNFKKRKKWKKKTVILLNWLPLSVSSLPSATLDPQIPQDFLWNFRFSCVWDCPSGYYVADFGSGIRLLIKTFLSLLWPAAHAVRAELQQRCRDVLIVWIWLT